MAMMKKDINFTFIIFLVAIIIAFASFTVFYQSTFKNLNSEYTERLTQLNKVTEDLQRQRSVLNETSYELQIKSKREEEYNVQYTTLKDERDTLSSEKEALTTDLLKKTNELGEKVSELAKAVKELIELRVRVSDLETEVSQKNSKISKLQASLDKTCQALKDKGGTC